MMLLNDTYFYSIVILILILIANTLQLMRFCLLVKKIQKKLYCVSFFKEMQNVYKLLACILFVYGRMFVGLCTAIIIRV